MKYENIFSRYCGFSRYCRKETTNIFIGELLLCERAICSAMFALMIAIPGNSSWESQDALKTILGNTPQIAIASIVAYWFGDFANDKVFEILRKHDKKQNKFALRAILSSLVGKYVDGAIFTFVGLSFLPLNTKLIMVANCPFVQVCIETALLPITMLVVRVLKKVEPEESNVD